MSSDTEPKATAGKKAIRDGSTGPDQSKNGPDPGPPTEQESAEQEPAGGRGWAAVCRRHLARPAVQLALITVTIGAIYHPFFSNKLIASHDLFFHQRRTVEYLEAWTKGSTFLPIWSENAIGGRGRPFFLYAAPLVHAMGASLTAIVGNGSLAIHIVVLLLCLLAAYGIYFWIRLLAPAHVAALCTFGFITTDYIVRQTLARGALAEAAALAFFTVTLWIVERYLKTGRLWLLGVASALFALVTLAHNLSLAFLGPALVIYIIAGGWRYGAWRRALACLAVPALGMAATAFFWVPSVAYRTWIDTTPFITGHGDITKHFLSISKLFQIGGSTLGLRDPDRLLTIPWTVAGFLGSVFFLLRPPQDRSTRRFMWTMAVGFGLCLLFLSKVTQPIWVHAPFGRYLQFPWRLLGLIAIFSAGLSLLFFVRLKWRLGHVLAVALILLPTLLSAVWFGWRTKRSRRTIPTARGLREKLNVSFGSDDEIAPRCVRRGPPPRPLTARDTFHSGADVKISEVKLGYARRTAKYVAARSSPVILKNAYFPLWRVEANGKRLKIRCVSHGYVQFTLPAGKGRLVAEIRPSTLMIVMRWVSLCFWLLIVGFLVVSRRRRWQLS